MSYYRKVMHINWILRKYLTLKEAAPANYAESELSPESDEVVTLNTLQLNEGVLLPPAGHHWYFEDIMSHNR